MKTRFLLWLLQQDEQLENLWAQDKFGWGWNPIREQPYFHPARAFSLGLLLWILAFTFEILWKLGWRVAR